MDDATLLVLTIVAAAVLYYFLRQPYKRPTISLGASTLSEEYFRKTLRDPDMSAFSGACEGYQWTQTDTEVEVQIRLPGGTRAKDVVCKLFPTSLSIVLKGQTSPLLQVSHNA